MKMAQFRNKTILIATGLYPPDVGGPATYSYLLNEELPKYGWTVKILSFGEFRFLPKIFRHFVYAWKIFKIANNYQIIYVQDPVSVGLPVCLACWLRRRSYILKIVGDYAWEQGSQRFGVKDFLDDFSVNYKKYSWVVRLLKLIQTGVAKRADKIIVPSNYLKKIVSNWEIDPQKIKVIYNAFNVPAILPDKETLRSELKLKGKIMVSAGRLVPWKGFELIIKLMPNLLNHYPDLKLFIAGEGPDKNRLSRLIAENNLTNQVILTGRLVQTDLLKLIKAADLFVLNTSYEGFSHQLLEVMWCGTPIITTAVGGNIELIRNGENGLLLGFNNREGFLKGLKLILGNQNKATLLSDKAKKDVAGYNEGRMISELLNNLVEI